MKLFGGLLIGNALGCQPTNLDAIIDGLNTKIEKLEHQFDRSITPDAILDLTDVNFLPGTTDESGSSGVLEVTIGGPLDGIRGTVCDDHMNENAANMFCQMLGFLRASNATASLMPQDYIPILLDEIECEDTNLESCRSWKLGGGNCRHENDVFLTCTNKLDETEFLADVNLIVVDGTCISDSRFSRVLRGPKDQFPDAMSIELCRAFCAPFNQTYFGVENGKECYCGDKLWSYNIEPANQCDMPCLGNPGDLCGARDRMNIYNTVPQE